MNFLIALAKCFFSFILASHFFLTFLYFFQLVFFVCYDYILLVFFVLFHCAITTVFYVSIQKKCLFSSVATLENLLSVNQKIQRAVLVPAVSISLRILGSNKTYLVEARICRVPSQMVAVVHSELRNFLPAVTALYHEGMNQNNL